MINKKFVFPALAILLVGLLLGIAFLLSQNQTKKNDNEKIKIATSFLPVYDITKNIVGENAEVVQILPQGASPHTYEPSVNDQLRVENSDLLFIIGHDIDSWASDLVKNESSTINIVTLDKDIELLEGGHHEDEENHEEEDEKESEEDEDHADDEKDPHYWLSVKNAKIMAKTILDEVSSKDSKNTDSYKNNYEVYIQKLDELDQRTKEKLSRLENKELITFHDAFGYFAQEYGLEIVTTIEPFAGQEPTPQYLEEVSQIINEYEIDVLFKEPQLSEGIVKALAQDYGIRVETLDPEGGLEEIDSYIELIDYNADKIYEALK